MMDKKHEMTLTMNSNIFANFRSDFDRLLEQTVGNMEMKGAEDATITVKFGISLEKKQASDYLANGYDGMRDITVPTIKHDITSVMQVKSKTSGKFQGDYELVYNSDTHCYVFRDVESGQLSVYDDDYDNEDTAIAALPAGEPDDLYEYEPYDDCAEGGEE